MVCHLLSLLVRCLLDSKLLGSHRSFKVHESPGFKKPPAKFLKRIKVLESTWMCDYGLQWKYVLVIFCNVTVDVVFMLMPY